MDFSEDAATFAPASSMEGMLNQAVGIGFKPDTLLNPDIRSLQHTLILGLRGVSAYADHAQILGQEDDTVYAFVHEGLAATLNDKLTLDDWVGLVLKCGEANLRAMELLDAGNTGTYGHPVPTKVPLGAKTGKAILVSGHDLKDLEELLKQTQGKGINVYTHGEMLPTHAYPALEKIPPFLRALRDRVAESAQGIRRVPRRHPDDHQLHPKAQRVLHGQHLHHRPGRVAWGNAHFRQELRPGNRESVGHARFRSRYQWQVRHVRVR